MLAFTTQASQQTQDIGTIIVADIPRLSSSESPEPVDMLYYIIYYMASGMVSDGIKGTKSALKLRRFKAIQWAQGNHQCSFFLSKYYFIEV